MITVYEKQIKTDKNGYPSEIQYFENGKLIARLGVILDDENNFIGLRELPVKGVSPKQRIVVTTVDFIGLINWINTINTIKTIETIENIENIEDIKKVSNIKLIEVIESLPNLTVKGSEGIAIKQEAGSGEGWVKPTGNSDPDGKWSDEAKAYDSNDGTYAQHDLLAKDVNSGWLILTIASTKCSKVKFRTGMFADSFIDIDVLKDGEWTNVYYGSYIIDTDIEKSFGEGNVTAVRFRFVGFLGDWIPRLNEVSLYRVASAGGELPVHLYAWYPTGSEWKKVVCDTDGFLLTKAG